MMQYFSTVEHIQPHQLEGFFVGWGNPPSPKTHWQLLNNSAYVVLAVDEEQNKVVGFITAISDGILSAYIPLLEVLPQYQNRGIGRVLVQKMLEQLQHLYMIDLLCDEPLQVYYEKLGLHKAKGMMIRNYQHQAGAIV